MTKARPGVNQGGLQLVMVAYRFTSARANGGRRPCGGASFDHGGKAPRAVQQRGAVAAPEPFHFLIGQGAVWQRHRRRTVGHGGLNGGR